MTPAERLSEALAHAAAQLGRGGTVSGAQLGRVLTPIVADLASRGAVTTSSHLVVKFVAALLIAQEFDE